MVKKGSTARIKEEIDNDRKERNKDSRKRTIAGYSQNPGDIHMIMKNGYHFLSLRLLFIFIPYTFISVIHCGKSLIHFGTITKERYF